MVIIFARIADGATGGNNSVASAYLSDITNPAEKTKAFGMIGGIVGLGLIVGPVIGGLTMNSSLSFLAPILLTLSVSVATMLVMIKYLPESLPAEKRAKRVHVSIVEEFQFFSKIKKYSSNRKIKYLFFLRAMFLFVFSSFKLNFFLRFEKRLERNGLSSKRSDLYDKILTFLGRDSSITFFSVSRQYMLPTTIKIRSNPNRSRNFRI